MAGNQRTKRFSLAALRVAEGQQTEGEIARDAGIGERTLRHWKQNRDFLTCVQEHKDRWAAELAAEGLANQKNRMARYNDRADRMARVITARANDPSLTGPGHETGLLVRTYKRLGNGEAAETVEEYAVDTGLLREMRELEKQAAIEVGQWQPTEKLPGLDQVPAGGAYRFREVIVEMPAASGELESHATGPGETLGEPVDTGR